MEEIKTDKKRWLFIGTVILTFAVLGFLYLSSFRMPPREKKLEQQIPLVRTDVIRLASGPVKITGNGVVSAQAEIRLSAQVAGEVTYVSPTLQVGEIVEKGEVLLRIDSRNYDALLLQAQARRRSTEAGLAFTRKQIIRSEGLVKKGSLSREELDKLVSQRDEILATMELQKAQILQAQLDVEHTAVMAPFRGQIRTEQVDQGEYITPGRELARIFSTEAAEVYVKLVDEEAALIPDLWSMRSNMEKTARVLVQAEYGGSDYIWQGYIDRAERMIAENSRTVDVIVRIPNPSESGLLSRPKNEYGAVITTPPPLLIGMYVTVTIDGVNLDSYALIPRIAIKENDEIWVVGTDNRVDFLPITIIQEEDDMVTVVARGLEDGMRYITGHLSVVTRGMQVKTIPPGPAEQPIKSGLNTASR